jgi:L-threonylcarbamoyladenylate synthase
MHGRTSDGAGPAAPTDDGGGLGTGSDAHRAAEPDVAPLAAADVLALTAATSAGGVVLFPAEGVYGLAADPRRRDAVARMAALKSRDPGKPSAVMFWSLDDALAAAADAGEDVHEAFRRLLPGPVGVLVPNPGRRYAVAVGDGEALGIRVPRLLEPVDAPPVVQTSANLAGGPDALTPGDVPATIRDGCALVLDRGRRPGVPSTLVDLRGLADGRGTWHVVREGAVSRATVATALDGLGTDAT